MESRKTGGKSRRDDLSSDSDCMFHCNYPGCTYETNRSAHLKRHERTHTKERPYKCHLCDYCASRSDHLRRHYKIHSKVANSRAISHMQHKSVSYSQPRAVCAISVNNPVPVTPLYIPQPLDEGTLLFLQFIYKLQREARMMHS